MNVPRVLRRLFRVPYDGLRHFGVVREGVLYRCGQPRPDELAALIDRYNIRTVISLRGSRSADDPDGWEAHEREVCTAKGTAFELIPCNHKNPPTREQVEHFLSLCNHPGRRPVLIHCRLGQQRTLLFCALFRVHVDGLDPTAAEQEMDLLGFGAAKRRHRRLLEAFRALARMPRDATSTDRH
ncbi:MAG: tyrosine-protein phosphatase [Phycisphaerae bacterium]|nr:tyrosine-protein phosphatase [Phycisphaerae bacterium]